MNAESIPQEQPKDSSIINLPKPKVGGGVESGEKSLDEIEEDKTEDFSKQEIEKIVNNQLETFDEISKMKNEKERRGKIGEHINQILEEFEESEKTKKDFKMVMVRIQILGINDKLDKNDIDRSWNQKQTDELIKIFEENEAGIEGPGGFRDYFPKLHSLLTTRYKDGREKDTVSDLMANTIIKRIENGDVLSIPLQSEIRMWCQNIGMIDKNIRTDLLISALNNPGKLDEITSHELLANLGLYGRNFIRQIKDSFGENKNNSNKILKTIEVLNFLKNKKHQAGFTESGEEAEEILDEIYNENDNFFIKTRIEQILNYNQSENIKRNDDYDDKDLRENYNIVSYLAEGAYNEKEIVAASCYSRISERYGALYNYNGMIDSFFKLDQEIKNEEKTKKDNTEKLSVGDILREEGFKEESMSEEEYKKMVLTYKTLIELPMREKIENKFGVELKDFNIREQVQFVNFLSSKSIKEVEEVKEFLNQGQDSEAKNNRIKSFLSLESGEDMGKKILDIGEKLKPENADAIFAKYAKTVDSINENVKEIAELYEEIFFEKKINQNELAQAILQRASNLLLRGREELEKADQGMQKEIIEKIIKDFEKQTIASKKELGEFREIAKKLNESYEKITLLEDDTQDWNNFLDEWMKNEAPKELSEENIKKIAVDIEKHKHFDSQRIREMIEFYKKMTTMSDDDIKIMKDVGSFSDGDIKRVKESLDKDNVSFFGPKIKQLEKILPYQIAFERKLEKIIYGHETASLPEDLFDDMDEKIGNLKPEKLPSEEKQMYLPVGISSNLPEWENILNGKEKMAKPMDIYGYMFWLNNQEKNAKLVICDQMQASNYESLYGKSHNEAIEATKKIGEKEKRFYQKIINTFGLDNIEIVDYESFIGEQGEKFEKYKNLCNSLSGDDIWKEAFLEMVQESVSEKDLKDGKDKYLPYAIDELSWILGYDGIKVSHINEARYDALAVIIKNVEKVAKENNIDIFNLDDQEKEKLKPIINCVIQCARNMLNTKKLNLEKEKGKDSPEVQYYKKMHEVVGKIKKSEDVQAMKMKNNKIKIDFISPADLGSRSFGRRSKGENGKTEDTIKFKEAYSTYFCKGGADMFLESDQVVASPKGHIGGKILTFEKDLQIKYIKEVIKPILVQYFKTLEKAPDEYFEKTKKTKKELLAECKNSQTLSELLKFIQKNIMEPTFSE